MMPLLFKNMPGGGGGGGFDPQTQGTLVSWYDYSTMGGGNTDPVPSLVDSKTGNPHPLTSSVSPTVATGQQNGLRTANWQSGAAMHGGPDASTYPYPIAAVMKLANLTSAHAIIGPYENNGGLELGVGTSGMMFLNAANIANIGNATTALSAGAYNLVVATVDASSYAFYIDGVAAGSGSHSESLTGGMTMQIGQVKTNEAYFDGYIGEIQIYNSILSGGDLTALHSYIVSKWATP